MSIKKQLVVLVVCLVALASSALAQSKISEISGSLDCGKGEPRHVIPIPEQPGSAFAVDQTKCTWVKHTPVEGLTAEEFVNVRFSDVTGDSVNSTASGLTRYDNGDTLLTRSTGTADLKTLDSSGAWKITGGTGKLAGISGGGTYTCKMKSAEPGAGYTCDVEGKYSLPASNKE